jgi:hypothetical protein
MFRFQTFQEPPLRRRRAVLRVCGKDQLAFAVNAKG